MQYKFLIFTKLFLIVSIIVLSTSCKKDESVVQKELVKPNQFGLAVNDLIEVCDTIKPDETLSDILLPHSVSQKRINEIAIRAANVLPLNQLKADKELFIYAKWDSVETVNYFVYKEDPINFVVFDLRDTVTVYKKKKPSQIKEVEISGIIKSGLIWDLKDKNIHENVGYSVADIYESQIDFGLLQQNDNYSILFEEIYVDGELAGLGNILAARFNHRKKDYYAFRFDKEKNGSYFDENGKGLQGMFLTAPIKFRYRITSRYSSKRYHPILHRNKSHLGTDYAAPTGTPIQTVANGVVVEAGYTSGNGNYVKVKHNGTYTTQYLHMSRFAKKIKRGAHVLQGQVIGFVGSTGLATGPHVCFRFWKNGRQVNPLRERNQSSEPVGKQNKAEFEIVKDDFLKRLQTETAPNVTP